MDKPFFTIVIDDDPSVCKALRRLLQAAHMTVETFASGASFLNATLHREPDCLVLDIRMPGMSGPELRDRLRAAGRSVPIVFITAHIESDGGSVGPGAGVLRKPFDAGALLEAIRQAVRGTGS